MSRARDLADSADKDIAGTLTLDGLSVSGDVAVDTDTLFVDASTDSVGIGTNSPSTKLAVSGSIAGTAGLNISGAGWGVQPYVANSLVVDNNSGQSRFFATGADASTDGSFLFYTSQTDGGANERMRIDSSGNLLVGKTSTGVGTVGGELNANGILRIARSGGAPIEVNRTTSDGTIIDIRKDNSTKGSIGVKTSTPYFVRSSSGGIALVADSLCPSDSTGSPRDGGYSLGLSTNRFSDLFLSGGVYLGGTGSANYLDDYEEGTWTPAFGSGTDPTGVDYDYQVGEYVKIGKLVHCKVGLGTDSISTVGSGTMRITGLPFTTGATAAGTGQVLAYSFASSLDTPCLYVYSGNTFLQVYKNDNNATGVSMSKLSTGANANRLFGYFSYYTDS